MLKIVYITNIPSPYQLEWAQVLRKKFEAEFWFMTNIKNSKSGRPDYWNVEMPEYCRNLPTKFTKGEFCYCPTLKAELNKFNPDIVIIGGAWYMISWAQAYRWAVKNNKKIIAGPIEFGKKMYNFSKILRNRLIFKIIYSKIDLYLANAFIHYDYLNDILKTKKNVLFMNFDNYSPYLEHKVREVNNVITFMYGGAISRRLRVPELIKVFEKVVKKYNKARLVVGGYGPEKEICKQMVQSSKLLSKTVTFHDVKTWDEIPEVYEKCDVLINYASYSPGSGVILSAVASGMGVISSISVNSTRHFVVDEYNGFIIGDDTELFFAMEKYILNPELVNSHSTRSKEIGHSALTFDKHLQDFSQIIDNL